MSLVHRLSVVFRAKFLGIEWLRHQISLSHVKEIFRWGVVRGHINIGNPLYLR